MQTSIQGKAFIKREEGFRALPYKDIVGKGTIGYGHLIKQGEVFGAITPVEANTLLDSDCQICENVLAETVTVELSQNEYDALVSFIFNLGEGNFRSSTLLKKINASNMYGATLEFQKWCHAGDKVVPALLQRRVRESKLFSQGDYGAIKEG